MLGFAATGFVHDLITLSEVCTYRLHSCLQLHLEMDVSIFPPEQTLRVSHSHRPLSEINCRTEVLKWMVTNCSEGSGKKGGADCLLCENKKMDWLQRTVLKIQDKHLRASWYKTRGQAKKGNLTVSIYHPNKGRRMLMKLLSSTAGAIISTGSCWGTSANLTSAGNVAQKAWITIQETPRACWR